MYLKHTNLEGMNMSNYEPKPQGFVAYNDKGERKGRVTWVRIGDYSGWVYYPDVLRSKISNEPSFTPKAALKGKKLTLARAA